MLLRSNRKTRGNILAILWRWAWNSPTRPFAGVWRTGGGGGGGVCQIMPPPGKIKPPPPHPGKQVKKKTVY
ncbi:MAG: hypothetical protein OXI96_06090, partial [Acidimicrobiaceae bacterium]|nr:hypothetical protein [Acidimicrobiaceae bacterium]